MPCHASLNQTCIIPGCSSCHAYVMVVYYVVSFFPLLLLRFSSDNVVFVRTHSSTSVCLLRGLVMLPCGISGKMIIPSKSLLSLLSSCSLFWYAYAAMPTTWYIMPPILPCPASNPLCPSKLLFGYVTALFSPSYSVASCRWRLKFVPCWHMEMLFLVGTCLLVGISQYLLFN